MKTLLATCAVLLLLSPVPLYAQSKKIDPPIHGLGHVHMDISCSPAVSETFDRALALLHNFWYARALEAFTEVAKRDSDCAIAYWGAAKTYDHPFWDPPTRSDESAAWALVQKGMRAPRKSPREGMYLAAVGALYKDGGADPKSARDQAYVDAMATAYAAYPDDETKLFYGLALLATVKEGTKGFEKQGLAAKLFEEVYAKNPQHPGVLHYLIHVYDDPGHATDGLKAARAYAAAAPAVPHAQHMPSHIFTRLGYWAESATTNENAWRTSESRCEARRRVRRIPRLPCTQLPPVCVPAARTIPGCQAGDGYHRGAIWSVVEQDHGSGYAGSASATRPRPNDLRSP